MQQRVVDRRTLEAKDDRITVNGRPRPPNLAKSGISRDGRSI